MKKIEIQLDRYLSAIVLPDGRIYRHALSGGSSRIEEWGIVPRGHKEVVGWGEAEYEGTVDPVEEREINSADLAEIVKAADSGEDPEYPSAAWWYLYHVPYWNGINDGNRTKEDGPRLDVANRALEFYAGLASSCRR